VVDSPDINAFSAPGGYINVPRAAQGDRQRGAARRVLAHEIVHVTEKHSLKNVPAAARFVCNKLVYVRAYTQLGINQLPGGRRRMGGGADRRPRRDGARRLPTSTTQGWLLGEGVRVMADKLGRRRRSSRSSTPTASASSWCGGGYDTAEYGALLKKLPANAACSPPPGHQRRIIRADKWRAANAFSAGNAKPPSKR